MLNYGGSLFNIQYILGISFLTLNKLPPSGYVAQSHVQDYYASMYGDVLYILNPRLQDDKKLPKWSSRSSRDKF